MLALFAHRRLGQMGEVLSVIKNLAARRFGQAKNCLPKRRFTAAGFADQAKCFAFFYIQRNAVHSLHSLGRTKKPAAAAVMDFQVLDRDEVVSVSFHLKLILVFLCVFASLRETDSSREDAKEQKEESAYRRLDCRRRFSVVNDVHLFERAVFIINLDLHRKAGILSDPDL